MTNPWNKIFEHDFEAAYSIANQNYLETAQDFDLRARAISALLLGNYEDAIIDFLAMNEIEKKSNRTYDVTYMQIGLCYYALNDNEKALDYFKYPVTNRKEIQGTSDISVPPVALLFIALKMDRQDLIKIALKELKRLAKLKTPASTFLLGITSEDELNSVYEEQTHETLRSRKHCKVEFYKSVSSLQKGDIESYKMYLTSCVSLTGKYLEFEYYFAKVEFDKLSTL